MQNQDILYLGIDVGTTAIKAVVYNQRGQMLALGSVENETTNSRPGLSSQSMELVWHKTLEAIRSVCEQIDPKRVMSVGVCAQGDGLWLLDHNLEPVRNAILWNDQRANNYIEEWIEDGTSDQLSRYSRTAIWAGTSGAAYRWLKDHEPENAKSARYAVHCKDWINLKLTGKLTTDFTDATIPFLDLESGKYASDAFEMLGVPELEERLVAPQKSSSPNGGLCKTTAVETGLAPKLPVSVGCLDVAAMMVGMGLQQTGDVCMILGTTAVVGVVVDSEPFMAPSSGATVAHPYLDKWFRVLAPLSGSSALDWFTSMDPANFGDDDAAAIAERLIASASSSPVGSNGVIFLPFLNGERAPFVEPNAKASFMGVTSSTTQSDLARSVIEGVTFSLRHCFASTGQKKPGKIFLTGGGAKNHFWCEIIANVMGTTVVASSESDHGTWGAALLGAAAAGLTELSSVEQRTEGLRTHEPAQTTVQSYDEIYQTYQRYLDSSIRLWNTGRNDI